MLRSRMTAAGAAVLVLAGVTAGAGPAVAANAANAANVALPGSSAAVASGARSAGEVPSAAPVTVQVWLTPNLAAAQRFADAVSTPGNPRFGQHLSPAAYTAAYGPSTDAQAKVTAWLRSAGFTGIGSGPGRAYVRASAPASTVGRALHTTLRTYRDAAHHTVRANSGPLSVPRSLAASVLGITGLDTATPTHALVRSAPKPPPPPKPTEAPCSQYYGQHTATNWPAAHGVTSFPTLVCGYNATQLRGAYGADLTNTGKGQTVALIEQGLSEHMFLALQDYAKANKLPAPSAKRYAELSLGQGNTCGDPFDGEEQLDVEAAYAMAPGANQLVVGGDSCESGSGGIQGLLDADIAVLGGSGGGKHPLASIASNSWGNPLGEGQGSQVTRIEHAYLVQAAAEGVGMYFSTGDQTGVEPPSDDPYAISVGGTTLGIGKANQRLFETGWSTQKRVLTMDGKNWDGNTQQGADGGGTSLLWAQPGYQKGVVPDALSTPPGDRGGKGRALPDLSADADPLTGVTVGQIIELGDGTLKYDESLVGGTSLSAPLVAGMVAAAQQGRATPFGFLNPVLYKLSGTPALRDVLPVDKNTPAAYRGVWCSTDGPCQNSQLNAAITDFDTQSYAMSNYTGQVTARGYDTMTGLGTPNGPAFVAALRGSAR